RGGLRELQPRLHAAEARALRGGDPAPRTRGADRGEPRADPARPRGRAALRLGYLPRINAVAGRKLGKGASSLDGGFALTLLRMLGTSLRLARSLHPTKGEARRQAASPPRDHSLSQTFLAG